MYSIAVVTDSLYKANRISHVGDIIRGNLEEVFKDKVNINNYYIDRINKDTHITDDIILVMASSRALKIREYVKYPDRIIVANRTFLKSSIHPLFSIPANTDVLVVNDNIETVLDSVSALYQIGVNHVNLIPFEIGKNYDHIQVAVTPSEPEFIPSHIEKVIEIGSRVIDVPTMLSIMNILHINDKITHQRLYNYYQKIFSVNQGINENYSNYLARTEELDFLLDLSNDGILLSTKEGKILVTNKKFKEIFDINSDVTGFYLHEVLDKLDMKKYFDSDIHDDLIIYKKKYINVQKKDVIHFNNEIKMYFCFQEVTYIKKLEQNLSQKLRQKGQIARYTFNDIVSNNKEIGHIIDKSRKIAQTDLTIFITGESGTGKEVLAQAIHNASPRHCQPFIAINTAAIPDNLLESELFGYTSGSFTGALKSGKKGLFEKANNGTVFLDEIGDMPKHLQSKLLRVLQERQITPVGSDKIIDIDVRIIAATHNNPLEMIEEGRFRKDLFYRLNVFPIHLPPLRQRKEDIMLLLNAFTDHSFKFSEDCIELLTNYQWPGNVRELNNIASYIKTIAKDNWVTIDSLPNYIINSYSSKNNISTGKCTLEIYKQEINYLENTTDLSMAITVLKAIEYLNKIQKTAGRKHLLEILNKDSKSIGESRLRKILNLLKNIDLIIIKKGRKGSFITTKGKNFLKELSKTSI